MASFFPCNSYRHAASVTTLDKKNAKVVLDMLDTAISSNGGSGITPAEWYKIDATMRKYIKKKYHVTLNNNKDLYVIEKKKG